MIGVYACCIGLYLFHQQNTLYESFSKAPACRTGVTCARQQYDNGLYTYDIYILFPRGVTTRTYRCSSKHVMLLGQVRWTRLQIVATVITICIDDVLREDRSSRVGELQNSCERLNKKHDGCYEYDGLVGRL